MTEKLYGNFEDVGEELIGVLSASDIIYEANYNLLFNRPKINGVELEGDKSWADLGLDLSDYYTKTETTEQIANEIDTYDDIVKEYLAKYETKSDFVDEIAKYYTKSEVEEIRREIIGDIPYIPWYCKAVDFSETIDEETGTNTESFKFTFEEPYAGGEILSYLYDFVVPKSLKVMADDETHRTVTDEQIAEWDAKSEFDGDYNSLSNKPTIPTRVAELSDASEYAKRSEIPTDYATQDDIDTALNVPMSDVATVEGVGYDVAVSGNSAKLGMVGGRTVKRAVMKSVDLGTLEWYKDRTNYFYAPQFIKNNGGKIPADNTSTDVKVLCSNYGYSSEARVYRGYDDKCVCITQGGSLGVTDTSYSDSASFKSAMSGVMLSYESTEDELVSAKVDKIVGKSKWASVDLGTLSWANTTYAGLFWSSGLSNISFAKCDGYTFVQNSQIIDNEKANQYLSDNQFAFRDGSNKDRVYIKNSSYSDAASFKKAMQGVILYYEPTDTEYADTLDTYPIPAEIQQLDGYGLSVSDEIYNYVDFERKKFVKRVASVDLGDLSYVTLSAQFAQVYSEEQIGKQFGKTICSIYPSPNDGKTVWVDKNIGLGSQGNVWIYDSSYANNTAGLWEHIKNAQFIYELATPEEIDISQYISNDIYIEADGSVIYHSDSGLAVPYRMQTGIMSKLWETAMNKGGSTPAPSSGGMELLFEGVTSQASPADLSNITDYHAVLISIGNPPTSDTSTRFGSNVYLVSDLLMFSLTNPKRFNTYVYGNRVDCVITQDKKVYSESSVYNYLVVYGIK